MEEEQDPQRRRREDDPMVAEMRAALKELNTEWTGEIKLLRSDMNHGMDSLGQKLDFAARENAQRFTALTDEVKRAHGRVDAIEEARKAEEKDRVDARRRSYYAVFGSIIAPIVVGLLLALLLAQIR